MPVETGQEAPDFTLKDQDGNDVTLSSFRGSQNVVIVFYPFTFTGVCQGELCSLRDDLSEFDAVKAQVLAISCDSRHAQKQWSTQQGFTFPVLSDFWPHGAVARAYGVFNEQLGCANRATFVIDTAGKVVDTFESAEPRYPARACRVRGRARQVELITMVRFSDMLGGNGDARAAARVVRLRPVSAPRRRRRSRPKRTSRCATRRARLPATATEDPEPAAATPVESPAGGARPAHAVRDRSACPRRSDAFGAPGAPPPTGRATICLPRRRRGKRRG